MSRFSRFSWRLTATVVAALAAAVVLSAPVDAAPKTNSLSGNADSGAVGFNGTIISDDNGSAVRGTFQVQTQGGRVTVDATCLRVGAVVGGRLAGAAGTIKASTDPSLPVGSAIGVEAFDSDNPVPPDGLSLVAAPQTPGPNQCNLPGSVTSSITKGKITIRQGV